MSAPGPIRGTTGKDEWGTPQYIFDYWNNVYDFTWDAAASESNHLTGKYLDKEYDSLAKKWPRGERFWINPPFGGGTMLDWVKRCAEECSERDSTILALLPNNTDARWFSLAYATASLISFLEGRISFINQETGKPDSGNTSGSIFVAWHPRPFRVSPPVVEHIRIPKPKA